MAIIGKLYNVKNQLKTNPKLLKAIEYLESSLIEGSEVNIRLHALPLDAFDRYDLDPDFFALEQKFNSKPRSECFIESHKKYVDMQLIVSGVELMEHVDKSYLTLKDDFSDDRDLYVYESTEDMSKVLLRSGDIAIFFPEDAHLGCQMYRNSTLCVKTVIKLPVEFFK